MDFTISSRVWASDLTTSEKVVLLALDHLGDRDGFSWNGYERLSEVTGINLKSKYLTKIINKLEKDGYILIWRQHGRRGGRGYTHIYWPIIGRTDEEILEIVMRRFAATNEEARAIISQTGVLYQSLVKDNRISGAKLELTRDIKKGVPSIPIITNGYTGYTQSDEMGVPETPNIEKGVLGTPRSIESSIKEESERESRDPPLSEFQQLAKQITEICGYDADAVSNGTRQKLEYAFKVLQRKRASPELVKKFGEEYWWGKSPPTPDQLYEEWGRFLKWLKKPNKDGKMRVTAL